MPTSSCCTMPPARWRARPTCAGGSSCGIGCGRCGCDARRAPCAARRSRSRAPPCTIPSRAPRGAPPGGTDDGAADRASGLMLRAFPAEPTVDAGGTLTLHVATDAPRYSLRLERWGGGCVPVAEFGPFCGVDAAPGAVDVPWDWPAVTLALPPDLRSGAYVVRALVDEAYRAPKGPREGTPDARWGTALVVVRAPSRARVLVNLPLFTYHAYDVAHVDGTLGEGEGECLYSGPR